MVSFTCNLCGALNDVEEFATEPASCGCGSNVRVRALIHMLSMEIFGVSLPLPEFPRVKAIRGVGMTDKDAYARILEEKFDYTNTFYDSPPRLDLTESHPELTGAFDFILSADVLEHIAPPVERALTEACRLLKPHGFFGVTVYCRPDDLMREHFPELFEYRVVPLGTSSVLINRRRDGSLEIREDLVFHGGAGATLEMREFGITALRCQLLAAGFEEVHFLTANVPEFGIYFDHDVSQPLIARKRRFAMDAMAVGEVVDSLRRQAAMERNRCAEEKRLASRSRWLRIGRMLGVGPKFTE